MNRKKPAIHSTRIIYFIIFFIIWNVREILIRPVFDAHLALWQDLLFGTFIKLLVWTVPAVLLIKHFDTELYISPGEMLTSKVKWNKYIIFIVLFFLYNAVSAYITYGYVDISPYFEKASLVGTVIFVGITEETVFRGWLLNASLKSYRQWSAVLLNAVLFLLIHFPIWIHQGAFARTTEIISHCTAVFILSIIFSWSFIKSRNILVPIILHMSWNLFNILFFGS